MVTRQSARPRQDIARALPLSLISAAQLADARKGVPWWNAWQPVSRFWLLVTKGASIAECWEAYKALAHFLAVAPAIVAGLKHHHG
jgi:hypothetical protein